MTTLIAEKSGLKGFALPFFKLKERVYRNREKLNYCIFAGSVTGLPPTFSTGRSGLF